MKPHTNEEKDEARKKLPESVSDFLGTEALTNIYIGIQKKFNLDLRELMIISEIGNVTLMGLEAESALETNLHQWMPELSNAITHELVADMNDRLFKEAKRRLKEGILEPKKVAEGVSEPERELTAEEIAENARRERIEYLADDDPELLALEKAEQEEAQKLQEEADKELAEALLEAEKTPVPEHDNSIELKPRETDSSAPRISPIQPNIALQKLGLETTPKSEPAPAESVQPAKETPVAEKAPTPPPSPTSAKPIYKGGVDPYREPVE
ncbi:MAG: hypothetical protein V4449_00680 [Patescibacteria group bacterium]